MAEPGHDRFCIVVTCLPGSGKTTLGKAVAQRFNLDFLDKDDYLEELFDERGTGDADWRKMLSRESDERFRQDAERLDKVVLVSHWRPAGTDTKSGTPVEWIGTHFNRVIELCCLCPAETAAERFTNRNRHAGHLDNDRSAKQIRRMMSDYQNYLPLELGIIETIETADIDSLEPIFKRMAKHLIIFGQAIS